MITGMMLPNDNFSNVEVTNGKVVEASDSNVVVGITMPGLKDSLNISFDGKKADLDITLKDGMIEFNETGVQKLANLVKNDAQDAVDTIKKIVELGNDYQSFAGKSDDVKGTVKFIYKTEGIPK